MLSENQVKRILAQCKEVKKAFDGERHRLTVPASLQRSQAKNEGWIEALQLVVNGDTKSVRNTPISEDVG